MKRMFYNIIVGFILWIIILFLVLLFRESRLSPLNWGVFYIFFAFTYFFLFLLYSLVPFKKILKTRCPDIFKEVYDFPGYQMNWPKLHNYDYKDITEIKEWKKYRTIQVIALVLMVLSWFVSFILKEVGKI